MSCKDCPPGSKRPTPHPGPRCATHWRTEKARRKAAAHENRVGKVYGLEPGQYQQIWYAQNGVCAVCRRATGRTRRLSVDHDHKTGLVRGLLCRPCNDVLGHLRDDLEAVARLRLYLVAPPASALGIVAYHEETRGDDG